MDKLTTGDNQMTNIKEQYRNAKKQLTEEEENKIKDFIKQNAINISQMSFFFVSLQMQAQGFDGIPYRDCKTLKMWNHEGKRVKKGEKSRISGVVWINASKEEDEMILYAKEYKLFHKSQIA